MTYDNFCIFRYDNSVHHHSLAQNFPHHKHIGASERVIDCPQPSVGQVRDEVAEYLERTVNKEGVIARWSSRKKKPKRQQNFWGRK